MNKLPALEDIRVFVTAARLMNFSKAAEQLMVSPAYISKRIRLLEQNLELTLFRRGARSVNLTPEGEIVLRTGSQMLQGMDDMNNELRAARQEVCGQLRISCSTGFGSRFLNPFISSLHQLYPLLAIELVLLDRPVDMVRDNMDLDICLGGKLPEQHIARKLSRNERILCAAPAYLEQHGYPEHPGELEQQHACISIRERNQSPVTWQLHNQEQTLSITPNSQLSVNNGEVAKQWCLNGQGVMLRSLWSVRNELEAGTLVQVLPQWQQPADVYAVYTRTTASSASLRVFIEKLETYLQQRLEPAQPRLAGSPARRDYE